jgi:hypothetical protein
VDETTRNSEEEISSYNYPFIKLGFIIGIIYGLILSISYIILIHILKIYSLIPIFYIAIDIDGIYLLIYAIYVFHVIFDMTEKALEKLKDNNESKGKGKN